MNYGNIKLNSNEYTTLSNEEKLELIRFRIKSILNEQPDKHQLTVVYKGKRIKINKNKQGILRDLVSRERSIEKIVKEKIRQEELKKVVSELDNNNAEKLQIDNNKEKFNALINNFKMIVLDSDYYKKMSLEDKIKVINKEKKDHNDLMNEGIYLNDDNSKDYLKYLDSILVKLNVENISNKINEQDNIVDSNNEEKESKGLLSLLMGLPLISKIKNKESKKDDLWTKKYNKKKKRIATAICAGIIFITGLIGLKSCNNNKNNDNIINNTITDIDDSKRNEPVLDNAEDTTIDTNNISLNDIIYIDNNAPIYTNSYDASYNTNGYNALYDGSYDRIIEAVAYELNGNIYTIYRNEDNSYDKVDKLVKNGATLTSVLVTRVDLANNITHEGYYNVSNVKVRMR